MNPIEAMAKAIYSKWDKLQGWVPWVDGGNSHMQELARDCARAALDALADNVSDGMSIAYQRARLRKPKPENVNKFAIAAAIRVAEEE